MSKQSVKSEQITPSLQMVMDYDQKITLQSEYLRVFRKALGTNVVIEKFQRTHNVYLYENNGVKNYILAAAITYLGNPHPLFKKRIQLKKWYKDFYDEYKNEENTTINLIGVYHYNNMEIYCVFNIDDYINNELNSSSAHVYTNDLFQAVKNGTFEKVDMNSNHITVIKNMYLKDYFNGTMKKNPVISLFEKFNSKFYFDQWLKADWCIKEMLDHNWYQAKGTEWAGWFLEFRVDEFIKEQNCEHIMMYTGNKNKVEGMLDFDLFFGLMNFYGDLKASDIKKKEAPGNDQINTLEAINRYGRLWYILYEHETIKDIDMGSEMAIARMKLIDPTFIEGNHVSYITRMKHSVNFKKMYIFELNTVNMHEILSDFNQGHNSGASMAERAAKFLLNKDNMNNSIIFSYEV